MFQHIDVLAAQSMAHERERDLQRDLAQRGPRPGQGHGHVVTRRSAAWHAWLDDLLVRTHLRHAHAP